MRISLAIIILFSVFEASAQCSLNLLFPVEFSSSKFDAELILRESGNFKVIPTVSNGYWDKPAYLNGDSVFYSSLTASLNTNCINSNAIEVKFVFADDKLYGIFLEAKYKGGEHDSCLSNYNKIASEIMKVYPDYLEVNVKDSETQQKFGEAYKYYRSKEEKDNNEYTTARVQFSKQKSSYLLEIEFKDFDNVKIDNRGFSTG